MIICRPCAKWSIADERYHSLAPPASPFYDALSRSKASLTDAEYAAHRNSSYPAFASINVAGPKSRELLQRLIADVHLSAANLPYRSSGQYLFDCVLDAGAEFDIDITGCPHGRDRPFERASCVRWG